MKNEINQYCSNHSSLESSALKEIREYTLTNEQAPAMISGQLVTNTLKSIIKLSDSKNILEIGMFTGYSALAMAEVLPEGGHIDTCELCPIHCKTAKRFFKKFGYNDIITIHQGEAIKTLDTLPLNTFDMVFIDADKTNYINYYKKAMLLIKKGGVIILDNMLWSGTVLNPDTLESKTLNNLNNIILNDDRNINTLLPVRDGLMICNKL